MACSLVGTLGTLTGGDAFDRDPLTRLPENLFRGDGRGPPDRLDRWRGGPPDDHRTFGMTRCPDDRVREDMRVPVVV